MSPPSYHPPQRHSHRNVFTARELLSPLSIAVTLARRKFSASPPASKPSQYWQCQRTAPPPYPLTASPIRKASGPAHRHPILSSLLAPWYRRSQSGLCPSLRRIHGPPKQPHYAGRTTPIKDFLSFYGTYGRSLATVRRLRLDYLQIKGYPVFSKQQHAVRVKRGRRVPKHLRDVARQVVTLFDIFLSEVGIHDRNPSFRCSSTPTLAPGRSSRRSGQGRLWPRRHRGRRPLPLRTDANQHGIGGSEAGIQAPWRDWRLLTAVRPSRCRGARVAKRSG